MTLHPTGERNDSGYADFVIERSAAIRETDPGQLALQTAINADRLFVQIR